MTLNISTLAMALAFIFSLGVMGAKTAHAAVPPTPNDKVTVERVTFKNRINIDIAADLYMPANSNRSQKHMAIVVGHPFGGVKEQTSGLHAQKLAELGYVALAYDAAFYGDSGGSPRNIEVPDMRVEDYSAAVDFLSNHPLVDAEKIGVLGICGGGGYAVAATAIDHRIKALATVSMYDMGRARRQGLGDTITYEQRMKTLDEIGAQRTAEFGGAARRDISAVPASVKPEDPLFMREFYEYYRTPTPRQPTASPALRR